VRIGLKLRLPPGMDGVNLLVIGDGFESDVGDALVDEAFLMSDDG